MTTNTLTAFLHRAADLYEVAGGAKEANQVRELAAQLEPFAGKSLRDFGDFLALAAGYKAGDLRAYFDKPKPPPKPKAPPRTKTPKPTPAEQVVAAVGRLRKLHEEALEPHVTPADVDAALAEVGKLTVAQLNQVAAGCGFSSVFKKKSQGLAKLREWILGRRGSYDRAGA